MRPTRPITFGARLSVCFAWSGTTVPACRACSSSAWAVSAMGAHPSTRLLIEELLRRVTGGERVLDIGCGSGVLGLCALGARGSASWRST